MKKYIFYLVSLFIIGCSPNERNELIDDFFLRYEDKGIESAINYMYSTNHWMLKASELERDSIVDKIKVLTNQLGKLEGNELLRFEKISSSLEVHSYLVKYERQPIRFNFILYKSSGEWRFQEFQYDSDVINEIYQITDISWYH